MKPILLCLGQGLLISRNYSSFAFYHYRDKLCVSINHFHDALCYDVLLLAKISTRFPVTVVMLTSRRNENCNGDYDFHQGIQCTRVFTATALRGSWHTTDLNLDVNVSVLSYYIYLQHEKWRRNQQSNVSTSRKVNEFEIFVWYAPRSYSMTFEIFANDASHQPVWIRTFWSLSIK